MAEERFFGCGSPGEILLSVEGLGYRYPGGRSLPPALEGVSFELRRGECFGVVGESGSGKTTLARCLVRLLEPSEGRIAFRGKEVTRLQARELRAYRRRVQIVFQDPLASLNPRMTAWRAVEEPVRVHQPGLSDLEREERVMRLFELVGLGREVAGRWPHQLSGGQRQRLVLARALSVEPELLILDEPISALDSSLRAQILALLAELQGRLGLALLLIAHDLAVIRQLAHRAAVFLGGRIVEMGPAEEVLRDPRHPHTRALAAASDPGGAGREGLQRWLPLEGGENPSGHPSGQVRGCAYYLRCPHPGKDERCRLMVPPLHPPGRGGGGEGPAVAERREARSSPQGGPDGGGRLVRCWLEFQDGVGRVGGGGGSGPGGEA